MLPSAGGQCHLGEIDLLADLGVPRPERLLEHARNEIVYASAAAGILPPIGGVFTDVHNVVALAEDSVLLARCGFGGRPALHPVQVPAIQEAFRPSAEEIGGCPPARCLLRQGAARRAWRGGR